MQLNIQMGRLEIANSWLRIGRVELFTYRDSVIRPGFWLDRGSHDLELSLWRRHVVVSWGVSQKAAAVA